MLDPGFFNFEVLPSFYPTHFIVWRFFKLRPQNKGLEVPGLFAEPLVYNPDVKIPSRISRSLVASLIATGATKLVHLIDFTNFKWVLADLLSVKLGFHSVH